MERKTSPPDTRAQENWDEAMARARLRHMRAKPVARPPRNVGRQIRKITRKHLKGNGTPLARLKDNWVSIVGEREAALCRPLKLTGGKAGQTLKLAVNPAAATLIEHNKETLRQRISVAAGGNIVKIVLDQSAWTQIAKPRKSAAKKRLSLEQQRDLEDSAANIESPALKAAIVALGKAVLTDETS